MLRELWAEISGITVDVGRPPVSQITIVDDPDQIVEPQAPVAPSQPIAGYFCILHYRNSKGENSERRITCRRYEQAGDRHYLFAFCHERGSLRRFRADRIVHIVDAETGEIIEPAAWLADFSTTDVGPSGISWGLAPRARADLVAGLNALTFMARCDRKWHPLEGAAIERFITTFWLRFEIAADLPLSQILAHADRLRPDPEAFFGALIRCRDNPRLATLVRRSAREVIDADGIIAPEEHFWGEKFDRYFQALG